MHPSHPHHRPTPAVRGFRPDIYGLATLFFFVLVGQGLLFLMFWDSDLTLDILVALGIFNDEVFRVFHLVESVTYASNYVLGFTVGIALFGMTGRKIGALAPVLTICSPVLNFLLLESIYEAVGSSVPFGLTLIWVALSGVFYSLALAGWAYSFGRSAAGVAFAATVGLISLTAYNLVLTEWGYDWVIGLRMGDLETRFVFAIFTFGYLVIMVAVLALSCVVGPGHARKPVAPATGYAQGPAGSPRMPPAGRYMRGPAGPPPVMPPRGQGPSSPQTGMSQHEELRGEWPRPREPWPPAGEKTHWP